ncbi:hypothetical protein OH77DRAFT_1401123 [Trametes cingulata]|nr:hypothetical protein OH77DRAFT_1401123 [Trametes cingulata]
MDQGSQVVPSSQSNERELRISDVLPPATDLYKTPASPLRPNDTPITPLVPDAESDATPGSPSKGIVESSQSQSEHDITALMAETLSARQSTLSWYGGKHDLPDHTPSSPPRPAESQDYDANDEYSQSQSQSQSQASTFSSPTRPSASSQYTQYTDSLGSSLDPYPITPSQVRRFKDMFEGRDEYGNELAQASPGGRSQGGRARSESRSPSPSPSARRVARRDGSSPSSTPRGRAAGAPLSYSYAERPSRSRMLDEDVLEGTEDEPSQPLGNSQVPVEESQFPTPVRHFLDMFDGSQVPL